MADSKRKDLVDGILTELAKVSNVKAVTDDPQVWATLDAKGVPRLFVNMGPVRATTIAFLSSSTVDTEGESEVVIDGIVQTRGAKDLETTMDGIMAGTCTAMEGLAVSGVTILDSSLATIDYTKDHEAGYGIFRAVFRLRYLYNHLAP